VIDKVDKLLSTNGVFGVADFYVAGKHSFADHVDRDYGVQSRHVNWVSRQFWRIWYIPQLSRLTSGSNLIAFFSTPHDEIIWNTASEQ
jgi:hypothetical protein